MFSSDGKPTYTITLLTASSEQRVDRKRIPAVTTVYPFPRLLDPDDTSTNRSGPVVDIDIHASQPS
jgi:hypothetical protein